MTDKKKEDRRYKPIKESQKWFQVHLRFPMNDYLELRKRAEDNNLKIATYVRRTIFADKFAHLNDDWELYILLKDIKNILTKTGNYLVKVRSAMDSEGYENTTKLKDAVDKEVKAINFLTKVIADYKKKANVEE